jgi:alpha-glucosidase
LAICRGFAELHINFASYILELADHAAKTGEPIVRTMEYEFPGFGAGDCRQQFMLGDRWLVAPVVEPGGHVDVRLPEGRWLDDLGELHVGPKKLRLEDVHLGRLPRFMRQ